MQNYKVNEIFKVILKYMQDESVAEKMFQNIYPYIYSISNGEDITMKDVIKITPEKLYEIIDKSEVKYTDFIYVIARYITEYSINDIGFPIQHYQDVYNKNKEREKSIREYRQNYYKQRKQAKIQQRKQKIYIAHQDFDTHLIINEKNIIDYISKHNNIEFVNPNNLNMGYIRNWNGVRNGKLVFGNPFKKKNVKDQSIFWVGLCDCGGYVIVQGGRAHNLKSCGICDNKNLKSYIGEKRGHLECIEQKYLLSGKHTKKLMLKCKCDCGNEIIISKGAFESENKWNICHKNCKLAVERRTELGNKNTVNLARNIYKNTNISKFGRVEKNSNNSTGYLGVWYNKNTNKYLAYITFQNKREDLGWYDSAATAYSVRLTAQGILQANLLEELETNEYILENKHLKKLTQKIKQKLIKNKLMEGDSANG